MTKRILNTLIRICAILLTWLMMLPLIALVLLNSIDEEVYRDLIARELNAALGERLHLKGELDFQVSWNPSIVLSGAELHHDDVTLMTAGLVNARVDLLSLFYASPKIDHLSVVSPEINISNAALEEWREAIRNLVGRSDAPAVEADVPVAIAIDQFVVGDLTLRRDRDEEPAFAVYVKQLRLFQRWYDQQLMVESDLDLDGLPVSFSGHLGLSSALDRSLLSDIDLNVMIAGENEVAVRGRVQNIFSEPMADLQWRIESAAPKRWLDWLGLVSGDIAQRMSAEGDLSGRWQSWTIAEMQAGLTGERHRIELQAALKGSALEYRASGHLQWLDRQFPATVPNTSYKLPGDAGALSVDVNFSREAGLLRLQGLQASWNNALNRVRVNGGGELVFNQGLPIPKLKLDWEYEAAQFGVMLPDVMNSPRFPLEGRFSGRLTVDGGDWSSDIQGNVVGPELLVALQGGVDLNDQAFSPDLQMEIRLNSLDSLPIELPQAFQSVGPHTASARLWRREGQLLVDIASLQLRGREHRIRGRGSLNSLAESPRVDLLLKRQRVDEADRSPGDEIALSFVVDSARDGDSLSEWKLAMSGNQADLRMLGSITDIESRPVFLGTVELRAERLAALRDWFSVPLPDLDKVAVKSIASIRADEMDLRQLELRQADNRAMGRLRIRGYAKDQRLRLDGQMAVQDFRYPEDPPQSEAPDQSPYVFSAEPFGLDWIKDLDADLTLTLEQYRGDHISADNLSARVLVDGGRLMIDPIRLQIGDGALTARFFQNFNLQPIATEVSIRGSDLDLNQFRTKQLDPGQRQGKLDVQIQLQGKGASWHQALASADGEALLSLENAHLRNSAIEFLGVDLLSQFLRILNPFHQNQKTMNVECAVLRIELRDGLAQAADGIAMQTKKISMLGSGQIDLRTEQMELDILPRSREGLGIGASSLVNVARLGGTLKKPELEMDPGGLLKSGARVGAAIFSGGLSILAQGLFNRLSTADNICQRVLTTEKPSQPEIRNPVNER